MTDLDGIELEFDLSIDNYLKNYKILASAKDLHKRIMEIVSDNLEY
jgi:hypothetical protein